MGRPLKLDSLKCIAYVRVSTSKQDLGPEAQRADIVRWAAANGVTIVAWYEDKGISGAAPIIQRPGLTAALRAVRDQRCGVLVAAKRDRFARDVVVVAALEREVAGLGARLTTTDGTSDGNLLTRRMHDVLGEHEREVIGDRTRKALGVLRALGRRLGGHCPYGYRWVEDGIVNGKMKWRVVEDEAEQAVIAKAKELHRFGWSQRTISEELAKLGMLTRAGTPFGQPMISQLVRGTGR